MSQKNFGLAVEQRGRSFVVTRYGHRFWAATYNTKRTAQKWVRKAKDECRVDPLAGVHFAPGAVRRLALKGAR